MSFPSSMADFVPCDRLLQKAYCEALSRRCKASLLPCFQILKKLHLNTLRF